jgi:hypothetical protein
MDAYAELLETVAACKPEISPDDPYSYNEAQMALDRCREKVVAFKRTHPKDRERANRLLAIIDGEKRRVEQARIRDGVPKMPEPISVFDLLR